MDHEGTEFSSAVGHGCSGERYYGCTGSMDATVPCAVPQSDLKEDEGGVSQLKPCRLLEHGKSWRLRFCRQYGDILLVFSRE